MILKVEASDSGEIIFEWNRGLGISEIPVPSSLSLCVSNMDAMSILRIPRHGTTQAKEDTMALSYSNFNQESRLFRSKLKLSLYTPAFYYL